MKRQEQAKDMYINAAMKILELHRIRNQQKDIEYKFRTIGGLAI